MKDINNALFTFDDREFNKLEDFKLTDKQLVKSDKILMEIRKEFKKKVVQKKSDIKPVS